MHFMLELAHLVPVLPPGSCIQCTDDSIFIGTRKMGFEKQLTTAFAVETGKAGFVGIKLLVGSSR